MRAACERDQSSATHRLPKALVPAKRGRASADPSYQTDLPPDPSGSCGVGRPADELPFEAKAIEAELPVQLLRPVVVIGRDEDPLGVGLARRIDRRQHDGAGDTAVAELFQGVDMLHESIGAIHPQLADAGEFTIHLPDEEARTDVAFVRTVLAGELLDVTRVEALVASIRLVDQRLASTNVRSRASTVGARSGSRRRHISTIGSAR